MNIKEGYVICNNLRKESILANLKEFKNYIFLSESSLIGKIFGVTNDLALFKLMKEYNLSYDLAKEYIKYIPFVVDDFYNNIKLDSLVSARRFLEKEGLLKKDDLFINRLSKYPVTIVDFYDKKLLSLVKNYINKYTNLIESENIRYDYKLYAYKFKDSYEEALYVMNTIVELYEKGISLNNIYIMNMSSEYEFIFKRLSKSYNIPIDFSSEKGILSFDIAKKFLFFCEILNSFEEIINVLDTNSEYYNSIVNIINKYNLQKESPDRCIDFLKEKLKEISIEKPKYREMVKLSDSYHYNDTDYVFFLNCNLGVCPKVFKDEEYLSDEELNLLGLSTSTDKNDYSKHNLKSLFTHTKNLFITLKETSNNEEAFPANILEELNIDIKSTSLDFGYSKLEDSIRMGKAKSKYDKYGVKSKELEYDISDIKYNEYDNKFSGISKDYINDFYLNNKLKMAYSNLKTYYSCPFAYYLDKVLDINEFVSSNSTRLGSFSHKILEESYNLDFDFNKTFENSIEEYKLDNKDLFYFNQMKSVLYCLIEYNKSHEEASKLNIIERELFMKYENESYSFIGFVDKLMYTEINGEIYAAIIDYKTGKDYISLDNVEDGFNLQLPCYMFLLSNYEKFKGKKIHIIGIYLQKVNIIALDNTIDIVSQREKSFRLKGYSTTNLGELSLLDPNYSFSDYIQSMSTKKDGSFGAYAKVINDFEVEKLIKITKELIDKASENIKAGRFDINPKRIDGEDKSCTYCGYKDICFRKYEDGTDLEKKIFFEKEAC